MEGWKKKENVQRWAAIYRGARLAAKQLQSHGGSRAEAALGCQALDRRARGSKPVPTAADSPGVDCAPVAALSGGVPRTDIFQVVAPQVTTVSFPGGCHYKHHKLLAS